MDCEEKELRKKNRIKMLMKRKEREGKIKKKTVWNNCKIQDWIRRKKQEDYFHHI